MHQPITVVPLTTSKNMQKKLRSKRMLIVTKLFNMALNNFDAKKTARYIRVIVETELVVSGTQCICSSV